MSSVKALIEQLERDLLANPMRISAYASLPFAILCYPPTEEWGLRSELRLLGTRLENQGRTVVQVSLAKLLWQAIDTSDDGMNGLAEFERQYGFEEGQRQVATYLNEPEFTPLADLLAAELNRLDPETTVAFLVHAASMGPDIYPISRLLDEMDGRTRVPTVLFYPGVLEGVTGLKFMWPFLQREGLGNYRVKVYGRE